MDPFWTEVARPSGGGGAGLEGCGERPGGGVCIVLDDERRAEHGAEETRRSDPEQPILPGARQTPDGPARHGCRLGTRASIGTH